MPCGADLSWRTGGLWGDGYASAFISPSLQQRNPGKEKGLTDLCFFPHFQRHGDPLHARSLWESLLGPSELAAGRGIMPPGAAPTVRGAVASLGERGINAKHQAAEVYSGR